jgi:membrane protein required for colicin V production
MNGISILDLIIGIPACLWIWFGYRQGLIRSLFSTVTLLLSVWIAVKYSEKFDPAVSLFVSSKYTPLLSFLLIFVSSLILLYLSSKFLTQLSDSLGLGMLNRPLGALFGAGKVVLFFSAIICMIDGTKLETRIIPPGEKEKSVLYEPVKQTGLMLMPVLQSFKKDVEETVTQGSL